jgi:hypothetical protein
VAPDRFSYLRWKCRAAVPNSSHVFPQGFPAAWLGGRYLRHIQLEKYLVVARSTEMWHRMYRVPESSPERNSSEGAAISSDFLINANPSMKVEGV